MVKSERLKLGKNVYKYNRSIFNHCDVIGQQSDQLRFETPLGDLGATCDYHLRLIGKRVGDFLLVLIEHFSLDFTAEAL